MRETVLAFIESLGLSPEAAVLLLATLPIFELRGSVPVGILLFKLPVLKTAIFSIVGNMIPIVPILFLFEPTYRWLSRYPALERLFEWLFRRTRRKGKVVERLKVAGLILFVAIPLPVTGAWTGSVAAFLFRIPVWQALPAILCGVTIACIVVTLAILGIIHLPGVFGLSPP
jgi:uncharacterized membrane protein